MDFGGSTTTLSNELTTDYQDSKLTIRGAIRQVWASLAVHSLVVIVGMTLGFSAILLPQLQGEETEIPITKTEASWLASIVPIVAPLGSLLAGPVMQMLGSRATLMIALAPYTLGWLLITFSTGLPMLLVGRFITGFATTFGNTPCIVYITEISSPHLRPMLTATGPSMVSLGILLVYLFGWLLSWRIVAGIAACINVFCFATLCTIPESPVWLVSRGRKEDAHKALLWFHRVPAKGKPKPQRRISKLETVIEMNEVEPDKKGTEDENEAEWAKRRMRAEAELRFLLSEHKKKELGFNNNMQSPADEMLLQKRKAEIIVPDPQKCNPPKKGNDTLHRLWLIMTLSTCYKPMIILFVLFLLQQFSGIYITLFYAVGVFEEMGGGALNAYIASILVGIIRFSMSLVNIWLFRAFGRRPLCIFSACGMAIAMLISGCSVYSNSAEQTISFSHVEKRMVTSLPLVTSEMPFNFNHSQPLKPTTDFFNLPPNISDYDSHISTSQLEGFTSLPNFISRNHVFQTSTTLKPQNYSNSPKFGNLGANNIKAEVKTSVTNDSEKSHPTQRTEIEENSTDLFPEDVNSEENESVQISRQKKKSIIPAICMLLYVCISMTGFLAIPWTLTAELFPTEVRSLANSLILSLANFLLFAALHTYPHMLDNFGPHGVLWFFSITSAIGAVFVYFFLPETRNKSLSDIEEYFAKNTVYTLSSKK